MAIKITDQCINCGACEPQCPNGAIYPDGEGWRIADKTSVKGDYTLLSGEVTDANTEHTAVSNDYYYIVTDKCTECKGFHDKPQCAEACPVDCCITDEDNIESEETLLAKKEKLHL